MRRSVLLLAGLTLALSIGTAGSAWAEDPVRLSGAYIVDTVSALEGRESDVRNALDTLANETGVQVFVVVVDSFTGVASDESWALATANLNRLGDNDVLFAVATVDRNFDISYPDDFRLSESRTDRVFSERVEPPLRDGDYSGAAIAFADGLRAELTSGGVSWQGVLTIVGVIAVAALGVLVYLRIRARRAQDVAKLNQKELDQRAGRLLVQVDDSIKTSEQELDFARAQFGDAAAEPFAAALAGAHSRIRAAFEIRQKLDDAFPETAEEQRQLTLKIIELCEAADAELDAQADAFDELRALEKTAPDALAAARTAAAAAGDGLERARATLDELAQRYSPAAIASISGNPDQAQKLLDFIAAEVRDGYAALERGESGRAAVSARAAQAAVGQVDQLLQSIDELHRDLAEASAALGAVILDTQQDLAAARALPPNGDAGLASAIAAAETSLASAASGDDPISALLDLQAANSRLDTVLASVREQQEQVQRASAALDSAIGSARAEISAANRFITTRRGGIGGTARTRVSEAMRHLDAALAGAATDPVKAVGEARLAGTLARDALAQAQADVMVQTPSSRYTSPGSDIGGALLGGIIGGMLQGGSSSRWNGGIGTSRGGSRSGSFGGSSRRPSGSGSPRGGRTGRRSSGGRF